MVASTTRRQQRAVEEQHGDEDDGKEQIDDQRDGGTGQELADGFQLAHAGHGIAHAARLEIGERQPQEMAEQVRAETDIDARGGVGEDIGAQRAEDAFEQDHGQQADGQHVQRGECLVHQHLVDHHLEEQRHEQCEQLQEERGDQDFRERFAVLDDGRDEPGEIEFAVFGAQVGALGEQDQAPVPELLEHLARDQRGGGFARVLDEHAFGIGTGK